LDKMDFTKSTKILQTHDLSLREKSFSEMQAIIKLQACSPVLPKFPDYGICILESRHAESFSMESTRYNFSEVMLVLEGGGWFVHGSTKHPVARFDLMLVPKGVVYQIEDRPNAPMSILCLCIRPKPEQDELWAKVLPTRFSVPRSSGLTREVAAHMRTILFEQSVPRECTEAVVVAQTLLLLSKLKRRVRSLAKDCPGLREVSALARVKNYLQQLASTFQEPESNETAAARLGMSSKSLTAYFRQLTGKSRQQYLQELRIEHACLLLVGCHESVASISFACGFEDLSTFFRAFRHERKMSPNQWRMLKSPPEAFQKSDASIPKSSRRRAA
jgi:AraC-like DNA-binding protein/mannose-6-phosphate isomerase-like protein (cupin superfamily)